MSLSDANFIDKMNKLNATQQSIETTSAWCCLWRSDAQKLVSWWENYFANAPQAQRLNLLYLANDILQNSRRKGLEFVDQFYRIMPRALRLIYTKGDDNMKYKVRKVVKIWVERNVFGSSGGKVMQQALDEAGGSNVAVSRGNTDFEPATVGASPAAAPAVGGLLSGFKEATQLNLLGGQFKSAERAASYTNSNLSKATSAQTSGDALAALKEGVTALQKEHAARGKVIASLRQLLAEQESASQATGEKLKAAQIELQQLESSSTIPEDTTIANQAAEQPDIQDEAARIAAQLANNPAVLLDALASLPKTTQEQVTASFIDSAGGGGLSQSVGGGGGDIDEYDPEDF